MRITSIALTPLVLICLSLEGRAGEPPLTRIIIEVIKGRPDRPIINHREFTIPEAVHWLKESEGIIGRLRFKDKELIGKMDGEKTNTPFGNYIWHGPITERQHVWDCSGWLPEELSQIYPSCSAKSE